MCLTGRLISGAEAEEYKIKNANTDVIEKEVLQVVSVAAANRMDSLQNNQKPQGNNADQSNAANAIVVSQNPTQKETFFTQIDSLRENF